VKVERTPKCHPEIAGEGVECDWGYAKGAHRCLPISEKRTKSKFGESAKEAMDSNEAFTIARRRLCGKRARERMLAHNILDNSKGMGSSEAEAEAEAGVDEKKLHRTACLIAEKIAKQRASHRSATDFDAGFVNRIVDKMREQRCNNNKQFSWLTTEAAHVLMIIVAIKFHDSRRAFRTSRFDVFTFSHEGWSKSP
jgi:hypothetical protein